MSSISDLLPGECRLLVYDLDGTLIDSLPDIRQAVNTVRSNCRVAPHSQETVRNAIGDGARVLCSRVLADLIDGDRDAESLFQQFRSAYRDSSMKGDTPRWYHGARELLRRAGELGIPQSLLTNKPRFITDLLLPRLEVEGPFFRVVCPEDCPAPKPDPGGLLSIVAERGSDRSNTLFIGDSAVDFATGAAAGIVTVGVRGGYYREVPPQPDIWIPDLEAILNFINESNPT